MVSRWLRELSGALGDSGVFVPLALALIAVNGFHPTPIFLVFGVAYAAAGLYYRLPIPVQPLKAMAVLAVATGASISMISTAALEMAVILGLIAMTGGARLLERVFTRPLVRGIQLGIGLLLVSKAVDMAVAAGGPANAPASAWTGAAPLIATALVLAGLLAARERLARVPAALLLLVLGAAASFLLHGLSALPPLPRWAVAPFDFSLAGSALVLLVVPQLPLTLGNAVVAASVTAEDYYGHRASRVGARALCTSTSIFNLIAALAGGFPICHGSGGLTAHYRFGARTGWSTFALGVALVILALAAPGAIWGFMVLVPGAVLAAMLAYIGLLHAVLVKDVLGDFESALPALLVGATALVTANLMIGILVGGAAELAFRARRSVLVFTRSEQR